MKKSFHYYLFPLSLNIYSSFLSCTSKNHQIFMHSENATIVAKYLIFMLARRLGSFNGPEHGYYFYSYRKYYV
ncbi:hypothetical protein C1646_700308 [Rhizophagus diaphanus]|nr:hypothetical protein C1646_700308 [Rhizophagus diaphanus] [Rhizophagus sp. MUCL 43196]